MEGRGGLTAAQLGLPQPDLRPYGNQLRSTLMQGAFSRYTYCQYFRG